MYKRQTYVNVVVAVVDDELTYLLSSAHAEVKRANSTDTNERVYRLNNV